MKDITELQTIVSKLRDLKEVQHRPELSPLELGRQREEILSQGLAALATALGVTLRGPIHIDANGEFPIVAEGAVPHGTGCGQYGHEFAAVLSKHNPRMGLEPTDYVMAANGWCRMNHFDVERMLVSAAQGESSEIPSEAIPAQYAEAKAGLPEGAILALKVGDSFEFFGDDARRAAEALPKLMVTYHLGVATTGFRYEAEDDLLAQLTAGGCKVETIEAVAPLQDAANGIGGGQSRKATGRRR